MLENKTFSICKDYYIRKKEIYTRNRIRYKISNNVEIFNKDRFAEWMRAGFAESPAKSQRELKDAVKSDPATISRLMTGAPQTNNNKASQPPKDLVIRLAQYFKKDVNEALTLAGYAPLADASDFDEKVRVAFQGAEKFTDEEKTRVLEAVRTFVAGVRAENQARENQQM